MSPTPTGPTSAGAKPTLLVLASTYPRHARDHEPSFVHELSRRLLAHFDVVVLTSRSPGASRLEWLDSIEVHRYAYAPRGLETLVYGGGIATHLKRTPWKWLLVPGFVFAQWLAARRIMKSRRIDLVHAHWLLPQGWIARVLRTSTGAPAYVVTAHGVDVYGFRGATALRLKRKVAADSAAMSVVSAAMRHAALEDGLAPPRIDVIPMGVDLRERFVADADVARDSHEILFVGRLVEKKGVANLIAAMPRVLAQHPRAHLSIAGFGPLRAELEASVRALGIENSVQFLGAFPQAELPSLYRRAGVLAAPFVRARSGDREGLPVVLMEAIGCGCPVIAGEVPGVRDLLGDDADDLCVPPGNIEALVLALCRVLADPACAQARAMAARAACASRVDWDVVASRYAVLLRDALCAVRAT
jgi:glycosyltransferase involved in cell wall biosynthesis